ncbi:MAG: hypothetical protein LC107_04385 [Chitinophagales bacterium]|nr:hypothetical protein [Chitinophagales bacterium]
MKIKILLITILFLTGCNSKMQDYNLNLQSTKIFTWSNKPSNNLYISPVLISFFEQNKLNDNIEKIKQMPENFRAIRLWHTVESFIRNKPSDKIYLHWDYALEECKKYHDNLFKELYKNKVNLDYVILDMEDNFSNWSIETQLKSRNIEIRNNEEVYKNIVNATGENTIPILKVLNRVSYPQSYLEHNANAKIYINNFLNESVLKPLKKYYPNALMSNYDSFIINSNCSFPEINGHKTYLFPVNTFVGTNQSSQFYGRLGQVATTNKPSDSHNFSKTPYNAFLYEFYKLKSIQFNDKNNIHAWIAPKSWTESKESTMLYNSEYYDEIINHLLVSKAQLLFWDSKSINSDYEILLRSLNNFEYVKSKSSKVESIDSANCNIDWNANYVISTNHLPYNLYRLTYRNDNNSNIQILNKRPLKIKIEDLIISLNDYELLNTKESYNNFGCWISKIH